MSDVLPLSEVSELLFYCLFSCPSAQSCLSFCLVLFLLMTHFLDCSRKFSDTFHQEMLKLLNRFSCLGLVTAHPCLFQKSPVKILHLNKLMFVSLVISIKTSLNVCQSYVGVGMWSILSVLCREWGCGVFCQSYIGGGDVGQLSCGWMDGWMDELSC